MKNSATATLEARIFSATLEANSTTNLNLARMRRAQAARLTATLEALLAA